MKISERREQIVHMKSGRNKDNSLLSLDDIGEHIEQSRSFLFRPHHHKVYLHSIRQWDLLMHIAVIPKPSQGKICQIRSNSSTKHQPLGSMALRQDFLELDLKLILSKQLISLIEDNSLHPCQLQVSFTQQLHQSTRSSNDYIRVNRERLKLTLVSVTT